MQVGLAQRAGLPPVINTDFAVLEQIAWLRNSPLTVAQYWLPGYNHSKNLLLIFSLKLVLERHLEYKMELILWSYT